MKLSFLNYADNFSSKARGKHSLNRNINKEVLTKLFMLRFLLMTLMFLATLILITGVVLMFTIFWVIIGLPLIILGLITWLLIWLYLKKKILVAKIRNKRRKR